MLVISLKVVWVLYKLEIIFGKAPAFGKFDKAIFVFDVGQFVIWWYSTVAGFSDLLHANWVIPIHWLTPFSYIFFILQAREGTGVLQRTLAALPCIALAIVGLTTGVLYAGVRFNPRAHLGAGSYIPLNPFPVLPASTTSTCRDLLHNSASPLYTDPNWFSGRLTQLFVALGTAYVICLWAASLLVAWWYKSSWIHYRQTPLVAYGVGLVVQFIALIWLSVIASKGVPLMVHEGCGVVVVAMSPARGYYDSNLHYEGLKLQAARSAFGMCKSLSVQTEYFSRAECTSQRRLYIISRHSAFRGR
jgi:hypothetical protein